jgi:hypothetical protein
MNTAFEHAYLQRLRGLGGRELLDGLDVQLSAQEGKAGAVVKNPVALCDVRLREQHLHGTANPAAQE